MSPKRKHIPQRTCIACRSVKGKRELVRIVRTPDRTVVVDETGKAQGRGAYLCRNQACWRKGLQQGIIGRALKITVSAEDIERLKAYARNLPESST